MERSAAEVKRQLLLERYPTTTLSVRLPDASNLQVVFPSSMILHDVVKVIVCHIQEAVAIENIFLFTCPSKSVLKLDLSLLQLGLTPASVVYAGDYSNCCFVSEKQSTMNDEEVATNCPSNVSRKFPTLSDGIRSAKRFRADPLSCESDVNRSSAVLQRPPLWDVNSVAKRFKQDPLIGHFEGL